MIRVHEYGGQELMACDVCNEQHGMFVPASTRIVNEDKISRTIGYRCRQHPWQPAIQSESLWADK